MKKQESVVACVCDMFMQGRCSGELLVPYAGIDAYLERERGHLLLATSLIGARAEAALGAPPATLRAPHTRRVDRSAGTGEALAVDPSVIASPAVRLDRSSPDEEEESAHRRGREPRTGRRVGKCIDDPPQPPWRAAASRSPSLCSATSATVFSATPRHSCAATRNATFSSSRERPTSSSMR